jgi:hypothetical protein
MRFIEGRWHEMGVILCVTAWMASLSLGYSTPSLVAGTLFVFVVEKTLTSLNAGSARSRRLLVAAFTLIGLPLFLWTLDVARSERNYFDVPKRHQIADLSAVDDDLRWIRTGPTTYRYLAAAAECIERYPARRVAILPDNAALYPVLDLENPFSTDWMIHYETRGAINLLLADAEDINERGDFLVLFQTTRAYVLPFEGLPSAEPDSVADPYGGEDILVTRIQETLKGRHIACGPFVGEYAPA